MGNGNVFHFFTTPMGKCCAIWSDCIGSYEQGTRNILGQELIRFKVPVLLSCL